MYRTAVGRVVLLLGIVSVSLWQQRAAAASREQILAVMRSVCDWQIAQLPNEHVAKNDTDTNWIRAVFFDGDMALYRATNDDRYLHPMLKIAEDNHWQPGKRFRHADDLAVAQLYTELYFVKKDPRMLDGIRQRWDQIISQPMAGREDWWWCDALFMDPPGLARLSATVGDRKYLDWMDNQWWDTTDFLYDKSEHLYFRDKTFFDKREANGKKIFWSRGNGWVLAGIARVLQFMPADYPNRPRYLTLFTEMADRITALQPSDGIWRMSLLDPDSYPHGESSGSALFCYALAWGINQGILPADKYKPAIDRAWNALMGMVEPSGKLDWVQLPGSRPTVLKREDTAEYGPGTFLLAGCEMLKLVSP